MNLNNRDVGGLCRRFQIISKNVKLWDATLTQSYQNRQNGQNANDVEQMCRSEWHNRVGHNFSFENCYLILRVLPLYNQFRVNAGI